MNLLQFPFALLEVKGPDSLDFLNRLLTNQCDVAVGKGCHAYYLSVQGRPLAEFFLFRVAADEFWLVSPVEQAETGLAELDKMHFGEKLKMRARTDLKPHFRRAERFAPEMSVEGSTTHFRYYSVPFSLLWGEDDPPAWPDAEELELWRIQAGQPAAKDYGEKTMFLEIAGPDAYSETKGCYPGQEVVARTLHRGHINRKLMRVRVESPAEGRKLLAGGKEVGWLTPSIAAEPAGGYVALAFLRREHWASGTRLEIENSPQSAIVEEAAFETVS